MNGFKKAFLESTVIQGVVTLLLLGVICYLVIVEREVPEFLAGLLGLVLGFWFRTKASQ